MRIAIIGAGILGANLAYACARAGADVIVVDAAGPAAGATGRSFGWINASFFHDTAHFELRAAGIDAYRRLCRDLDLPVAWSGCLCWEEEGEALERQAKQLNDLGYSAEIISKSDVKRKEPHVVPPPQALSFRTEAAAEPGALTHMLLSASQAKRLMGCAVEGIETLNGQVTGVRVAGGVIEADRVIVAAGTHSPALLAPLGVELPMLHRPGVIFQTKPVPKILTHICVAPIGEFRQRPDGRIMMPTAVSHQSDSSDTLSDTPEGLAEAACARLQAVMPDVLLEWEEASLANRPVPKDGLPVLGACGVEGLFTAVMHSGITLAPVVARILAAEVTGAALSNAQAALVAPYRPDRFQAETPA